MRHKKLKLRALILLGLGLTGLQAQTMFVKQSSSTQTAYALNEVQKMTFSSGNVTVSKTTGSFDAFALSDIRYLNFQNNSYLVSAGVLPVNSGTVAGAGNYNNGATVSLTATPTDGYTFVNWTENGTPVSTSSIFSFTANASRSLVANFIINSYLVSAGVLPVNSGTVAGAGNYDNGATVSLTATPTDGYTFVNWTENGTPVSTSSIFSFTANASRSLVANFMVLISNIATVEPQDEALQLFPNPVADVLNIQLPKKERQGCTIEILSVEGRVLHSEKLNPRENIAQINVANLPQGIYLCRISSSTTIKTTKFLKQ